MVSLIETDTETGETKALGPFDSERDAYKEIETRKLKRLKALGPTAIELRYAIVPKQ